MREVRKYLSKVASVLMYNFEALVCCLIISILTSFTSSQHHFIIYDLIYDELL